MFTGLVHTIGKIRRISTHTDARDLVVDVPLSPSARAIGASVAVDGVCLTVTASDATSFVARAAFETLSRTTLGELAVGHVVNIEPALCMGDSLGGHLVSGHVDGVGQLRRVESRGDARACVFGIDPSLMRFVAAKGSICVSGVSLTVNAVRDDEFEVGLVPHTLAVTTLGSMSIDDRVNIEVDLIARYVERLLTHASAITSKSAADNGGLRLEHLVAAGFCPPSNSSS